MEFSSSLGFLGSDSRPSFRALSAGLPADMRSMAQSISRINLGVQTSFIHAGVPGGGACPTATLPT
jgi:hypothetical protein